MTTKEPLPTPASLLNRLKDASDHASWVEVQRTYRELLVGVARRAGLNEHEADEAVQETLIAVAKTMPEFSCQPGKDSFIDWLLQIVRWKIVDQLRRRREEAGSSEGRKGSSVAQRLSLREGWELVAEIIPADTADPRQDLNAIWEAEWEHFLVTKSLKASDAGRSAGGILGSGAFQALTPDNQVAELYRAEREEPERKKSKGWLAKFWSWLRTRLRKKRPA